MKCGWIECLGGASGNMFLGAFLDLGVPLSVMEQAIEALELKGMVQLAVEKSSDHGITGHHVRVLVGKAEEEGADHHGALQGHGVHFAAIRNRIENAPLAQGVREIAVAAFNALAVAEGKVHGVPPEDVHFHEVGEVDALVDIVCAAAAADWLQVENWYVDAIPLGRGWTQCAHGRIPLPAPATLQLLVGFETFSAGLEGEMVTPTGAAILNGLGARAETGRFLLEGTGYGLGTRRWPDRPNLLRIRTGREQKPESGEILEVLETNLDDMNPEWLAPLQEQLIEAGALDAWVQPIVMKKGRSGWTLSVLATPERAEVFQNLIFSESTTLGVRRYKIHRVSRPRTSVEVETKWGTCRVKVAAGDTHAALGTVEFEDALRLSRGNGIPLREVYRTVMEAFERTHEEGE